MPRSDITTGYLALAGDTTVFPRVIDYLAGVAVGGTALVSAMLPPTATAGERTRLRRVSPLTLTLNGGFGRVSVAITNADLTETANIAASVTTWIGKTATLYKWITIDEGLITEQFENVALLVGIVTGYRLDETGLEIDLVTRANRASTLSNRRVGSKCPWTFKGTECGYVGVETVCNKLYSDTGGCSGRSNQHRFGGFPDRAGVETIGRISGLGAAPAYQLVQLDTTYTEQRTTLRFDDTFAVTDDPTTNATVITAVGGGVGGDATPDWIDVKEDHNAVGDGVADDTAEIQAAIDAAEAGTVKTVFFPAGTYNVTGLTTTGNVTLLGSGYKSTRLQSTTNAVIVDCTAGVTFEFGQVRHLRITGSTSAGSAQVGLKIDDATYGLAAVVRDVVIEDCGGAGLYVGNAFSSHFENIYSTNCAGGNFIINSANMPALTLSHCDSGVINDSYRTGYHIKAGNVTMRDCNSVYGGDNPEWCVTIGRRIGQYGEAIANGAAFARFEGCNFESSEIGGVQCFYNSRASFHNCTWVGAGSSSGSYVAVQYDMCQYQPTETTGDITSGTNALTVADAVTWSNGQGIKVAGAGVGGADLTTTVTLVSGTSFTLAANASTTVSGAVVSHTDDIYYPVSQAQLGVIDDDCGFSQGPASYYADSEPIHITAYPSNSGAATIPPLAVNGRGPKISGDKFISNFRNDTTDKTWPLPRMDGYMPVQTITASTTYTGPGVRYIECNHSAPITITLPWPGWLLQSSAEPIIIKDRSSAGAATNNITIAASGGGSVNGSSYVINTDKGAVILMPHSDDDYRVVAAYTGAAGNVTGPGSATDTAIAKFNGTTGKIIQNSGVTIDGSNNINTAGFVTASRLTATGEVVATDGYFTAYSNSAGTASTIAYRRGRGTSGTPAAVQSGDVLYYLAQQGYTGSGFAAGAYMLASASENWSGSANGSVMVFTACPNGSTDAFAKGFRVDPTNASIEPNGDTAMSLGRAAYRFVDAHLTGNVTLYERSAPGTPAANSLVLYAKDKSGTAALYYKNDAGTETELGAAGANTALSNLASVAVNTSLLPGADNTHDLGSASYSWRDAHIERDALLGRQIQSSGSALSASAGTGAGTGPSITIDGNAIAGAIILTTGTSPATSAQIVQMTMTASFTTYPVVIITPANAAAAALTGNKQVFIDDAAMLANKWTLKSGSTALDATTDYVWYFHVMGI